MEHVKCWNTIFCLHSYSITGPMYVSTIYILLKYFLVHGSTRLYCLPPSLPPPLPPRYIEEPTDFHSIVYRRSDIQLPAIQGSRCGSSGKVHKHMTLLQNSATADEQTESKHRFSRQTRDSNKVRCWLNVIGDYEFYEAVTDSSRSMSFRVQQAAALLTVFIRDTDEIYQTTNFDQDLATVDNIQFGVRRMEIISEPETGFFANPFIGVEAFLNEHSTNDWSDFCLSYRFTYRDFDGGVLGLAYIAAQPGSNARG